MSSDVTAHPRGCGRMTAKAESPPTNGNEMKVLRRAVCSWSNGALVLGSAFITDNRNIDGILMFRIRHLDHSRMIVNGTKDPVRNVFDMDWIPLSWVVRLPGRARSKCLPEPACLPSPREWEGQPHHAPSASICSLCAFSPAVSE
jgi:hypothetical protein